MKRQPRAGQGRGRAAAAAARWICPGVRRMQGYVPGEQPAVPGLIKLNTNENPYPPSPAVGQALAAWDPARLRLYPDPLSRRLREAAARLHGCRTEQVFAGNGSDEILSLCTRAFVANRGTIGYFEPSYSLYPVLADIRGVAQRPVALGPEFEWRMPARYRASLFFLTYPNAPTGLAYPRRTVRAFCRAFPGVVVIDEAYADFADENCMEFALRLPNVLVMRTLSKSYSLAGLRVGYVVGNSELIAALFKIKDSYNLDGLAQALAAAAIDDQAHMRANVERIRATRRRLTAGLEALGCRVLPSSANFLWTQPAGVTAQQMFDALRADDILVRYFPGPRTGRHVRITVGTDAEADRLLESLRAFKERTQA